MGEIAEQTVTGKFDEETNHFYWLVSMVYRKIGDGNIGDTFGGEFHQFDYIREGER